MLYLWLCSRLLSLLLSGNMAFRQRALGSCNLLLHRLLWLLCLLWCLLYRLLSNKSLFTVSDDRTSWLLYLWLCSRLLSLLLSGNMAFRQRALGSCNLLLHRLLWLLCLLWCLLYRLLSNKSLFTVSDDRTSWLLYLWLCSRLLSLLLSGNMAFRQRALGSCNLLLHRLLWLLLRLLSLLRRLLYRLLSNKSFFTVSDNRACWLLYLRLSSWLSFIAWSLLLLR